MSVTVRDKYFQIEVFFFGFRVLQKNDILQILESGDLSEL